MTARDHLRAVTGKEDPVAQWAELQIRYPEAGHWFDEGWHHGALRHHDLVAREVSLEALIKTLLDREVPDAAG
jgi:hypothetical protein